MEIVLFYTNEMRQILMFSFIMLLLPSCKKDKVPKGEPCTNVELLVKRSEFVGTWRWQKTWVLQTFASGNTYTFDYTPATEGFDYYCVITADGKFLGYKDSVLVEEKNLTSVFYDDDNGYGDHTLASLLNCSENQLLMTFNYSDTTDDILKIREYPLNFDDPIQKKKTSHNFFKRD